MYVHDSVQCWHGVLKLGTRLSTRSDKRGYCSQICFWNIYILSGIYECISGLSDTFTVSFHPNTSCWVAVKRLHFWSGILHSFSWFECGSVIEGVQKCVLTYDYWVYEYMSFFIQYSVIIGFNQQNDCNFKPCFNRTGFNLVHTIPVSLIL